jgi:cobalt-zinc-cadmium efflux system membrane fusion protein
MAAVFAPAPAGTAAVPRAAITDLSGESVVFTKADGALSVRKITTAGMLGDLTVVISGLKPGEQVAVSGLSELKSLVLTK